MSACARPNALRVTFTALLALPALGCGGSGPSWEYPEFLPPRTDEPVVPDTPRAFVPERDKPRAAAAARPEAGPGQITCEQYCTALADACEYHPSAAARSRPRCLADCSGWAPGDAKSGEGDTLACRMKWAREAALGVERACWNAGTASPGCVLGDGAIRAIPLDPGATAVLGLYDSTDARSWDGGKRARRTILGSRVRFALRRLGLSLTLWDMNVGLPPRELVARSRGIVTAFYDARLVGARAYGAWLRAQIEAGRRVVILNDYGAWRDASGSFVDEAVVNLVFEALGVRYEAQWTSRAEVLRTSANHVDPAVFERVPDPRTARHYYLFRPLARDVRVHLGVLRTDLSDSLSALVLSSPRGGMALTRYYEDRDGTAHVRLAAFLERALLRR